MKILMLGWELPPYNSGGLGVACYQMCKQLAKHVDIEFVLPYQPPSHAPFMKLLGATAVSPQTFTAARAGAYQSRCFECVQHDCHHVLPGGLRGQQKRYTSYVGKLVLENSYDAIHAHDWLTFEAGMRAKQLTGKPLIAHVHATEYDRAAGGYGNPLVRDIEYACFTMADQIVAVSQITKDTIVREYHIPADKIAVVHNSIDIDDFATPENGTNSYRYIERMKAHGYRVVVSVGRLTIQKGLPFLLQAAARALEKNEKLLFLFVGDGEQRDELIMQSASLGIAPHIIFPGFLRGKQWRDAFSIGDIFVMSSVAEPFGLVALEAAGSHNAIVLTKQTGAREVLRSVIDYDFWDTDKLADAIVNIAEQPALRDALATNAQHEFNRMSWHRAAELCHNLYKHHVGVTT